MKKGKEHDQDATELSGVDNEYKNRIAQLGKTLGNIGSLGTKFIPRLSGKVSIPKKLEEADKELLSKLNILAQSIPSDPYSAIILHDKSLYIAQNKATANSKLMDDKFLEKLLVSNDKFKGLKRIGQVSLNQIFINQYNADGNHPDTIAITDFANKTEQGNKSKSAYLGLAAFNDGEINNQKPASCSSCGAVIKALNDNGYQIKVILSTPTNFPSNSNYKIPNLISENPKLMDSFLKHIDESITQIQKKLKNKDEILQQYLTGNVERELAKSLDLNADQKRMNARLDIGNMHQETKLQFDQDLEKFQSYISNAEVLISKLYSKQAIEDLQHTKQNLLTERIDLINNKDKRIVKEFIISPSLDVSLEEYKQQINKNIEKLKEIKQEVENKIDRLRAEKPVMQSSSRASGVKQRAPQTNDRQINELNREKNSLIYTISNLKKINARNGRIQRIDNMFFLREQEAQARSRPVKAMTVSEEINHFTSSAEQRTNKTSLTRKMISRKISTKHDNLPSAEYRRELFKDEELLSHTPPPRSVNVEQEVVPVKPESSAEEEWIPAKSRNKRKISQSQNLVRNVSQKEEERGSDRGKNEIREKSTTRGKNRGRGRGM